MLLSPELINHKIGVIAVAGKYRTGKSFLMNRILLNKKGEKTGFGVGPTINPCTKVSSFLILTLIGSLDLEQASHSG